MSGALTATSGSEARASGRAGWTSSRNALFRTLAPALGVLAFQVAFFWVSPADEPQVYALGLTQGMLVALMAVGLALIHRANRLINFAQADLGILPASLAVNLIVLSGLNYVLTLALGLVVSLLLGGLVELAIMRRFFRAPRLVATVATIGIAQLLGVLTLWLTSELWDARPVLAPFPEEVFPFDWTITLGNFPFGSSYLIAWILAPLALGFVGALLRFTNVGVAIRASAEIADRAMLLGIPVKRLHTYVWALASMLSFVSLFLQAGMFGLPLGQALGLTLLIGALTALTLGRLSHLPTIFFASLAVGILMQAVTWKSSTTVLGLFEIPLTNEAVPAVLGLVIVAALLLRRSSGTRLEADTSSTWRSVDEVRPVPSELRRLPEVRFLRWGGVLLGIIVVIGFPMVFANASDISKGSALLAFSIIGMSLVVLAGWAGQISLGQLAFAAVGGAMAAKGVIDWSLDPALSLVVAAFFGAVTAVIVGLPALRIRGLYLAVVTLAFALATVQYFLNPTFFAWVPNETMGERPALFGIWSIDSAGSFYYLCLAVTAVVAIGLVGLRRSRTGRVLVAIRENERGAAAYGISVVRMKLSAFAISGALAAVGGGLLVLLQRGYTTGLYAPFDNLLLFTAVVVGGLGSIAGGVIGAVFLKGGEWWLPGNWRLLVSGLGVLVVLLVLPGGIGGAVFSARDSLLRLIARRRGIVVPSLLADVRDPDADDQPADIPVPVDSVVGAATAGSAVEP